MVPSGTQITPLLSLPQSQLYLLSLSLCPILSPFLLAYHSRISHPLSSNLTKLVSDAMVMARLSLATWWRRLHYLGDGLPLLNDATTPSGPPPATSDHGLDPCAEFNGDASGIDDPRGSSLGGIGLHHTKGAAATFLVQWPSRWIRHHGGQGQPDLEAPDLR